MEETIEHGGDGGVVAEELSPIFDRPVGGEQRAGALVATHDQLEEIFGRRRRQLAHAEIVDDEERDAGEEIDSGGALSVEGGFAQLFEQHVRFSVQNRVSLLDRGVLELTRFGGQFDYYAANAATCAFNSNSTGLT